MDKVLNELLNIDVKLRIINECECEFGENNKYYRRTEEDINEMIEDKDFTAKEMYDNMYLMMYSNSAKIKDFISAEGTSFSFVDEEFINERFMIDIRQNINHPIIKEIVKEELEFMSQSINDLISKL